MHPLIAQAIAAERTRKLQADAAAASRARQLRLSRHAPRIWLSIGISRAGRGLSPLRRTGGCAAQGRPETGAGHAVTLRSAHRTALRAD